MGPYAYPHGHGLAFGLHHELHKAQMLDPRTTGRDKHSIVLLIIGHMYQYAEIRYMYAICYMSEPACLAVLVSRVKFLSAAIRCC